MMSRLVLIVSILSLACGELPCARGQGTWTTESSNGFTQRSGLTSSVVPASTSGGKIFAFGGYDGHRYLNTLQVYDPSANIWTTPTTSGSFTARSELASSVVNDKIYVFGGVKDGVTLNVLEIFDPSTNSWSTPATTGIFTPRHGLTSSVVGGKIYVLGGWDSSGTVLNTLEVFDPATNHWSSPKTTGTFTPRGGLTSSVLNGKIFVMGGESAGGLALNTLEVFDPSTNAWSTPQTTGTFTAREGLASVTLNGLIYVLGGYSNSVYLNKLETFDPATNLWSKPSTVGTFSGREFLSASVVPSLSATAKIYAIGGLDMNSTLGTNEAYSPQPTIVYSRNSIESLKLSPNPTEGMLTISAIPQNLQRITVVNILGEIVAEIPNVRSSTVVLNFTDRPEGTYFVCLQFPNSIMTKMIIRR